MENYNFIKEINRYLSFWPLFIGSAVTFLIISLLFLRYEQEIFANQTKIQIIDKAMDSEMALPTAMTIFNRSTINLENEIEILKSFRLISQSVKELNSNVNYFTIGNVTKTQNHKDDWLEDYNYDLVIDAKFSDTISKRSNYVFAFNSDGLTITEFDKDYDQIVEYRFDEYDTRNSDHLLPFEFSVSSNLDVSKLNSQDFELSILPFENFVQKIQKGISITPIGKDSDLLSISMDHPNKRIATEFLDNLVQKFDLDGITDRQLVYKRTIDFVDSRYLLLKGELDEIELTKQNFKEDNNLVDISNDAGIVSSQKILYDKELFEAQSQLDLCNYLLESLDAENFDYMPVNIGIDNSNVNILISQYNEIVSQRNKSLVGAGVKNKIILNLEKELKNVYSNVVKSIDAFKNSLNLQIENLKIKENEYSNIFSNVPENEKILRSIEREQQIKEALFILLLQKREEAAKNFAVTKPSIKIIDFSNSSLLPIYPNKKFIVFIFVLLGLIIPFIILYLRFFFDTKIHTKEQLINLTADLIPIVGEVPHIPQQLQAKSLSNNISRDQLSESVRMILANLKFTMAASLTQKEDAVICLVTSSIKGEGKTLISSNVASALSVDNKVLLIGADLRNPQIHKLISVDKKTKGLSNIIHELNSGRKFIPDDFILKYNNLDVLLSGTIPPNPSELLSSISFKDFINSMKKVYDYIIIDSAPCLLVSDTLEISDLTDISLFVVRANHTTSDIADFIKELKVSKKINNLNLVLNGVGNSSSYGYKYGYQYGYRYKYSYNYGYGYGYNEDK